MIYVALAELVIIGLLVWINARERNVHDRAILDLMVQTGLERSQLLNRLANPQAVQPLHTGPRKRSPDEVEADAKYQAALGQIGTVNDAS